MVNSYSTNPKAQELFTRLAIHSPGAQGFVLDQGLMKRNGKVWIVANLALQTKLISAFHFSAIGGHSSGKATYHRMKQIFYWKGLKGDVEEFIEQCQTCQQAKHELVHLAGLLQPLPIPQGAW